MMDNESAKVLIDIIDSLNEPLEKVLFNFRNTIENRVVALTGISLLLTDGFLSFNQQVVALFLIYSDAYVDNIEAHPYYYVFKLLEACSKKPSIVSPQLKMILHSILQNNSFGFDQSLQASEIVNSNIKSNFTPSTDNNDSYAPRLSPVFATDEIDPSLPKISQKEALCRILTAPGYYDSLSINNFMNVPPVSDIFDNELFPVPFDLTPDFLFDPNSNDEVKNKVNSILERAYLNKPRIKTPDIEFFKNALESDPTVLDINVAFSQFDLLVEPYYELAKTLVNVNAEKHSNLVSEKILQLEVNVYSINLVTDYLSCRKGSDSSEEVKQAKSSFLARYVDKVNIIREKKGKTSEKNRKIQMILKLMCNLNAQGVWFSKDLVSKLRTICEDEKKNPSTKDDALKLLDQLSKSNSDS